MSHTNTIRIRFRCFSLITADATQILISFDGNKLINNNLLYIGLKVTCHKS